MTTDEQSCPAEAYDRQRFLKGAANDAGLARELLAAYVEDAPTRLAALDAAVQAKNPAKVAQWAHSIKGMVGVVRAGGLVEQALGLEQAGRAGDMARVGALYPQFRELFHQVLDEVAAHLRELAAAG